MQRLLASLVTLSALGTPLRAAGQEPSHTTAERRATAELRVTSIDGADCASAVTLAAAVEQRLQRRVFGATPSADLRVNVAFSRLNGGWTVEIALYNHQGVHLGMRRIRSQMQDCSKLDDSLALVVALMVDLTQEDIAARTDPKTAPESTAVSVPAEPVSTSHWSAVVSLSGIANHGSLPGIAAGGRVGTELRSTAAWAIEVGLSAFFPRSVADGPSAQADFSLMAADLGLCGQLSSKDRGDLRFCAGCELGLERAKGIGYQASQSSRSILVMPFVGLQSTWWPTTDLGLRIAVGAETPLVRDRFYVTRANGSQAMLFEPSAVAAFLQAGVSWQL